MATQAPDLMNLLCLEPGPSKSAYGGQHRRLLIQRDFSNSGDFVFNNLIQHFGKRQPNTPTLLVNLSHDWLHYSACAAKCGFNLRRRQNMGNIEVLNVMEMFLDDMCAGVQADHCDTILKEAKKFIEAVEGDNDKGKQQVAGVGCQDAQSRPVQPVAIMFDDLSILATLGASQAAIHQLVNGIDFILRERSKNHSNGCNSHLVIQTMCTNVRPKQALAPGGLDLNFLLANLSDQSDMVITLKPLESGHSTKVDGTIEIVDNRLPATQGNYGAPRLNLLSSLSADIGLKRLYYYKLADRRARLTPNALAL